MRYFKLWSCFILFFLICSISLALNIGEDAPKLDIARWIKGKRIVLYPKDSKKINDDKIYVIFFWATWSNSSLRLLEFVEKEYEIYKEKNVVFIGISKESPTRVKNFLEKAPNINFSLGIDDQAKTYDKYMEGTKGVPMFFVILPNKELAWKGSPFELDRVLSRVVFGTFDIDKQKKIETLRDEIRRTSQILDYKNKIKAAEKTLEIDPTDEVAINIIIDDYIKKEQLEEAVDFIEKSIKKTQGNIFLQHNLVLLELSIIRGMEPAKAKKYLLKIVKDSYTQFYNNPKVLNSISSSILQNMPFEIRPLNELLKMAIRCVALEKRNAENPNDLGIYYQTLARTYYSLGCFSKALDAQSKAVALIKAENDKKEAVLKEEYYKEALSQYKTDQIIEENNNKSPVFAKQRNNISDDITTANYSKLIKEKAILQAKLDSLSEQFDKEKKENELTQNILKEQRMQLINSDKYDVLLQEKMELEKEYNALVKANSQDSTNINTEKLKEIQNALLKKEVEFNNVVKEKKLLEQNNFELEKNYKKLQETIENKDLANENKVVELNKQIEKLNFEKKTLNNATGLKKEKISEYVETINSLQDALNKSKQKNELLTQKFTALEKNLLIKNKQKTDNSSTLNTDFKKTIDKLQLKILNIEKEKEELEYKRKELENNNRQLIEENKHFLAAHEDNTSEPKNKYSGNDDKKKILQLQEAINQEKKKYDILAGKYSLLQKHKGSEQEALTKTISDEREELKKTIQKLKAEAAEIKLARDDLEKKNRLLVDKNQKYKLEKTKYNDTKDSNIIANLNKKNSDLKKQVESLQRKVELGVSQVEESDIAKLYSSTENDSSEVQKLKKQVELSQSNIMRLQQYNEMIQKQLTEANEKLIKIESNGLNKENIHTAVSSNKSPDIKNDFKDIEGKLQSALKKNIEYESKLDNATDIAANLNEKIKLLNEEKNLLANKLKSLTLKIDDQINSDAGDLVNVKKDLNLALENNLKLEDKFKSVTTELHNEKKVLESKNNDLTDKVNQLASEWKEKELAYNENLVNAKKDLNLSLENNSKLEDKLKSARLNQNELNEQIKALQIEKNSLNEKIENLTFDLKKKADNENIELASAKKELNNALQSNLGYENKLKSSLDAIEELKSQNAVLTDENSILNKELKDVSSSLNANSDSDVGKKLELALLDNITYKNKLKIFDKKVDRLNSENSNLIVKNKELNEKLKLLSSSGTAYSRYSTNLSNEKFKEQIDELNSELSKLREENSVLRKDKLTLNRQIDLVKEHSDGGSVDNIIKYESLKNDYDEVLQKNLIYENRIKAFQNELDWMKNENNKLKDANNSIAQFDGSMIKSSDEYLRLKNELDVALQENLSYNANLKTLQTQIKRLEENNNNLKSENLEYSKKISDLNNRFKQNELIADDKYLDVQKELDLALQENLSYKNETKSIKEKFDELSAQNLKLKNDKISLNKEINEIMTRLKEVQTDSNSKYSNVKTKLDLALQDNLKLEKRLRSLDDDIDKMKNENNNLSKEKNELNGKMEELNSKFETEQSSTAVELSRVSKELDQAVQENLTFENKLRDLTSKINSLTQDNLKLKTQKDTYSNNIREVAQRLKDEHYERIRLSKELESTKLQYDISLSALQQENADLNKKLSGYQKVIKSISELNQ